MVVSDQRAQGARKNDIMISSRAHRPQTPYEKRAPYTLIIVSHRLRVHTKAAPAGRISRKSPGAGSAGRVAREDIARSEFDNGRGCLVNARFLLLVFDVVYALSLATWVGGILCYRFLVDPVVGRVLGIEEG